MNFHEYEFFVNFHELLYEFNRPLQLPQFLTTPRPFRTVCRVAGDTVELCRVVRVIGAYSAIPKSFPWQHLDFRDKSERQFEKRFKSQATQNVHSRTQIRLDDFWLNARVI
jgi:hypothetical protein